MIMFMQNDPCCNALEGGNMRFKIFVLVFQGHRFIPYNIFPDLRNAEAAFVIGPFSPY